MTTRAARRLAGVACLVLLAAAALVGASTMARAATTTTVSLTFDDGQATHYTAMQAMRQRGMVGTFYINSALAGTNPYYMPWSQVHEVADAGNEIGGHTAHHVNLTTVNATTARAEVCDDRTALTAQGFSPVSFAYPEAGVDPTAEQIVRDCGYQNGRDVGSLFGPQCPCPYVESVPPPDPYRLRTIDGITTSTTLANLQAAVTNAETHGGGWVPLVFHGICDGQCTGGNSMSPAIFNAFLDWLAARSAQGTVVRTVAQALSGTSPPTTTTTTPVTTTTTTPVTTTTTAPVTTPTPPTAATTVSLTFDDGQASHHAAMQLLRARSLRGTFYINSGMVGSSPYYMGWDRIQEIAAAGNEIGGHTLRHTNLTTVSATDARATVCDDRTALIARGFSPVTAFAYPEAGVNPTVEQIVRDCGYASGRDVGSLFAPTCPCPYAETLPPLDPYRLRTIQGVTSATTLADLQAAVTGAETHGGGWVPLVFHGVCDDQCTGPNSMSTATFTAFLDWVAARSGQGTVVRTVGEAVGATGPPPVTSTTTPTTTPATTPTTTTTPVTATTVPVTGAPTTTTPTTTTTTAPTRTVALTAPTAGTSLARGSNVGLRAAISGTAPTVAPRVLRVDFLLDGAATPVATDASSPYQVTWRVPANLAIGSHTLTAVAIDAAGTRTTSPSVAVSVR